MVAERSDCELDFHNGSVSDIFFAVLRYSPRCARLTRSKEWRWASLRRLGFVDAVAVAGCTDAMSKVCGCNVCVSVSWWAAL